MGGIKGLFKGGNMNQQVGHDWSLWRRLASSMLMHGALACSLYLGPRMLCMSGDAALEKCSSTLMFYCISKKQ